MTVCCRRGRRRCDPQTRVPWATTLVTGVVVALGSLVGDAAETYDLTNIGTLFAFALVCAGVLVLRVNEPDRPRPFRVPFVWVLAPLGVAACLFVMAGLPRQAWERFGIWLVIGIADLRRLRLPAQPAHPRPDRLRRPTRPHPAAVSGI